MGSRRRSPRAAAVLLTAVALLGAGGCGPSVPVSTPAPASSTTTSPPGLGFSDGDNGQAATVAVGQRLTVILHSSDFVFAPLSQPDVLDADGQPTVTPGGSTCTEVAGSGCGAVVASFVGRAPGDVELRAQRSHCAEPECPATAAHWGLLVHVAGDGSAASTTSTSTSTSTVATEPTTVGPGPGPGPELEATVRGTVRFSPVCPVERIPPDPACAPRPGAADVELVRPDGSVAAKAEAGDDGAFAISVAPGPYRLQASAPGSPLGGGCQADPADITLVPGASMTATVTCDTGIR